MTNNEPPAFSVHVTEGDAEDPTQQLKNSVKFLRETMETNIELNRIVAKLMREKYNALVKEGFKPEEALFLCKEGR